MKNNTDATSVECKALINKYMSLEFNMPDEIIFHGVRGNPQGFTFGECRALRDETEKLKRLKERLDGYYVNGLKEITNPFVCSIMVCVGLEVLGQVIFGVDNNGGSISNNTLLIYKKLGLRMDEEPSDTYRQNHRMRRGMSGLPEGTYADLIRKGLRNTFTHSYRSLGVRLGESNGGWLLEPDDEAGMITVDWMVFRTRYIELYEASFVKIISGADEGYRLNALVYLDWILR